MLPSMLQNRPFLEVIAGSIQEEVLDIDLAFAEVRNAAWKRIVLFGKDKETARASLYKCFEYISICTVIQASELVSPALGIAIQDEIASNDAFFVQLLNRSRYHCILWIKSYTKRSRETGMLSMFEP